MNKKLILSSLFPFACTSYFISCSKKSDTSNPVDQSIDSPGRWSLIFFSKAKEPEVISVIDLTKDQVKKLF